MSARDAIRALNSRLAGDRRNAFTCPVQNEDEPPAPSAPLDYAAVYVDPEDETLGPKVRISGLSAAEFILIASIFLLGIAALWIGCGCMGGAS